MDMKSSRDLIVHRVVNKVTEKMTNLGTGKIESSEKFVFEQHQKNSIH